MADYYKADKNRTSAKHNKNTPYKKIFIRQLIAALICFLLVKYTFSDNLKQNLKSISEYDMDFSFIEHLKINGDKANENKKTIQ